MFDPSRFFPRFLPLRDLAALSGRLLTERAGAEERAALAEAFDLPEVEAFEVEARLARLGRDGWRLEGRLRARATQLCVVTLAPVAAWIDEPFDRRFEPGAEPDAAAELLIDPAAEDPPEPLGAGIDLGAVAVETFSLALDPWPRAEGAAFEPVRAAPPGAAPLPEGPEKPFAPLAALKAKLERG